MCIIQMLDTTNLWSRYNLHVDGQNSVMCDGNLAQSISLRDVRGDDPEATDPIFTKL